MPGECEPGIVSVQCGSRSVEFSPGLFIHNEFVPSLQGNKFASYVRLTSDDLTITSLHYSGVFLKMFQSAHKFGNFLRLQLTLICVCFVLF